MIDISDKSVFESAQILRDKYVLERDDETKVYLSLMNIKMVSKYISSHKSSECK